MSIARKNKNYIRGTSKVYMKEDIFTRLMNLPALATIGLLLLFAATAFNLANFAIDKEKVALDWQVMVKLMILAGCGVYGGLGALLDLRVRSRLVTFPCAWMVLICGFYFLAAFTSIEPVNSLASAISLVCILLASVTAVVQVGVLPVLLALFAGMSVYILGSWGAYFLMPAIGIFDEPTAEGQYVARMSGLSHPNTLGQVSALTVIVGFILYFHYQIKSKIVPLIVLLAGAALVCSLSRASLGACMIALFIGYRNLFWRQKYMPFYIMAGVIGVLGMIVLVTQTDVGALIESKMAIVSKSGDADEITTATGRADIWGAALKLIAERPLTGWGAATSKYLLAEYSLYTHNLILNVMLSTGVLGGLVMLSMIFQRLMKMRYRRHPFADSIFCFLLINGVVENVIFSILAGLPTILWVLTLIWWQLDDDDAVISVELKEAEGKSEGVALS